MEYTEEAYYQINFDVAFYKNENKSCSGIGVRGSSGETLRSKMVQNKNIRLAFAIEALTCVQEV